ncbi:MAG TPA: hypothetical protein VK646_01990 [Actinomycetota bacterium]|nr:hypothetical protein [Actinomycetota bacterium]
MRRGIERDPGAPLERSGRSVATVVPFVLPETGASRCTLEVRWIAPGEVPEALTRWLGPFGGGVERRSDRYFVAPSSAALGLKIKDDAVLDLKAFRGSRGTLSVPGIARGELEAWEKWTFPLERSAVPPAADTSWLTVRKVRRRRSFGVLGGVTEERPVGDASLPGCSVELTQIIVGGEPWWTLGFEATGSAGELGPALRATVDEVLRSPLPAGVRLGARRSMSYPRWIDRHVLGSPD